MCLCVCFCVPTWARKRARSQFPRPLVILWSLFLRVIKVPAFERRISLCQAGDIKVRRQRGTNALEAWDVFRQREGSLLLPLLLLLLRLLLCYRHLDWPHWFNDECLLACKMQTHCKTVCTLAKLLQTVYMPEWALCTHRSAFPRRTLGSQRWLSFALVSPSCCKTHQCCLTPDHTGSVRSFTWQLGYFIVCWKTATAFGNKMERTIVLKVQHLILKRFLRFTINLMGFFFWKSQIRPTIKALFQIKEKWNIMCYPFFFPFPKNPIPHFFQPSHSLKHFSYTQLWVSWTHRRGSM